MKEYEDLTEDEEMQIKNLGMSEEENKDLFEYMQTEQFKEAVQSIWVTVHYFIIDFQNAINGILKSDVLKKLSDVTQTVTAEQKTIKRNIKSKNIKTWEKKKFYQ